MTDADALRAQMIAAGSMTAALDRWCAERGIGSRPLRSIVHTRAAQLDLPTGVTLGNGVEAIYYRKITLMAGDVPLLDADNWFLPGRLSPEAITCLVETDVPFGTLFPANSQTRATERVLVPRGAAALGVGEEASDDVPLLTLRGRMSVSDREVAYIEERFRLDALGG